MYGICVVCVGSLFLLYRKNPEGVSAYLWSQLVSNTRRLEAHGNINALLVSMRSLCQLTALLNNCTGGEYNNGIVDSEAKNGKQTLGRVEIQITTFRSLHQLEVTKTGNSYPWL
jgi:hypothetical protein